MYKTHFLLENSRRNRQKMTASNRKRGGGGGRSAPKKKGQKRGNNKGDDAANKQPGSAGAEMVEERDVDEQPYAIGHSLIVAYRDNSQRLAMIVERDTYGDGDETYYKYYIHYEDFNRRMDEWVMPDRIISPPSIANPKKEAIDEAAHEAARKLAEQKAALDEKALDDKGQGGSGAKSKRGGKASAGHGAGFGRPGVQNHHFVRRKTEFEEEIKQAVDEDGNVITTIADDEHDEHEGLDEAQLKEHEELTKIKNVSNVRFGRKFMECWYFSPVPKEYLEGKMCLENLYFCEFTFRFFRTKEELQRHQVKPQLQRHPPGNEIYRDDDVSMFELDGAMEKIYCQNLSYFAKLFLDHKTLYWDVDIFLFYVLCRRDEYGCTPVGFFSKQKNSDVGYNLACILTFPCEQRRGYGRFLISFSYELSKKENKVGSPEKPLSDLGAVSYRSYWASNILAVLYEGKDEALSVVDICRRTSIVPEDVLATLEHLKLLKLIEGTYVIVAAPEVLEKLMKTYPQKGLLCDPQRLVWTPLYTVDPKKDKWSLYSLGESLDVDNEMK